MMKSMVARFIVCMVFLGVSGEKERALSEQPTQGSVGRDLCS